MKNKTVTRKTLNNGKPTKIHYNITDYDLTNQLREIFVEEQYKPILDHVKKTKDAVVIDLGANIGNVTRYLAPYAKQIYSIEANPTIYECLVKNTESIENVTTFNFAVSYHNKMQRMFSKAEDDPAQTFFVNPDDAIYSQNVHCKTIDRFFEENKIEHVDAMKVDVEGSEYLLFPDQYFKTVAPKIDFIMGESHHMAGNSGSPDFIPTMLEEYGFKTHFTKDENMVRFLTYTNPDTGYSKDYKIICSTMFVAQR